MQFNPFNLLIPYCRWWLSSALQEKKLPNNIPIC
uniref:Uncharacterized protein n=1 Tax=Arundo donax TaxID=35708 RepID=A0A0A9E5P5_ARUDO